MSITKSNHFLILGVPNNESRDMLESSRALLSRAGWQVEDGHPKFNRQFHVENDPDYRVPCEEFLLRGLKREANATVIKFKRYSLVWWEHLLLTPNFVKIL